MNILIVQTGFLGDLILSTPVITNVRRLYPEAAISLLTTPQGAPLVASHPDVAEVIVFDKRRTDRGISGLRRMAARLREKKFDAVFSLHKSLRTAVLLRLAGIPKRYGFAEAAGSFLYSRTARRSDLEHDVLRNLAILRSVGLEPEQANQELRVEIPSAALREADLLLAGARAQARLHRVGIAPGSVWAGKRWTTDKFAQTARALHDAGSLVVLIGGPDDAQAASDIETLAAVPLLNLTGKTDLITSAAVISRMNVLITNDSAPLHLASAAGVPVVAIFCATVPQFGFGPWLVPNEIVQAASLSCRPCATHGLHSCPIKTFACREEVPAIAVIEAARRLLGAAAASPFGCAREGQNG